jgi:hypothetical protein
MVRPLAFNSLAAWCYSMSLPYDTANNVVYFWPIMTFDPITPTDKLNINNHFECYLPLGGTHLPPYLPSCTQYCQVCALGYSDVSLCQHLSLFRQFNSLNLMNLPKQPMSQMRTAENCHFNIDLQTLRQPETSLLTPPTNYLLPSPPKDDLPNQSKHSLSQICLDISRYPPRKKIHKPASKPRVKFLKLAVRQKLRELSAPQLEKVRTICEQFYGKNLLKNENTPVQTLFSLLSCTSKQLTFGDTRTARRYMEFLVLDWKELPENISLLQTLLMCK